MAKGFTGKATLEKTNGLKEISKKKMFNFQYSMPDPARSASAQAGSILNSKSPNSQLTI